MDRRSNAASGSPAGGPREFWARDGRGNSTKEKLRSFQQLFKNRNPCFVL
jgi:hypothetical protein